jgi:6-phospho-beta-glucosidase
MSFRFVVLGGSAVSTVQLIDAIADWPGGAERRPAALELVLHGRSPDRLEAVAAACRRSAAARETKITVRAEAELAPALAGADAVLNQIRIGGLEERAVDESFPRAFGLPGEETMGPGGLACAVRTVGALRPVWEQISRQAASALLINLTNPAGIIQQAARAEYGLPVVTVCDSPLTLLGRVAAALGLPAGEVRSRYVGMNHVGWYVPADSAELGRLRADDDGDTFAMTAVYQARPAPYMRYYAFPGRCLAAQEGRPARASELMALRQETLESYKAGSLPASWRRAAPWYRLAVVPLLDAWINGSNELLVAGLPNGARLPWLPADVIVEGPVQVSRPRRIEPQPVASLPGLARGLLAQHAAYESLTVEALTREPTAEALSRALLANPMVSDLDQADLLAAAILARHSRAGG